MAGNPSWTVCKNVGSLGPKKKLIKKLQNKLFEKIVACTPNFFVMLDEANSLSRKSAFIIQVRFQLPDMEPPQHFVELFELEDKSTQGIVLLRALECVNFTHDFLSKTLTLPQVWSGNNFSQI